VRYPEAIWYPDPTPNAYSGVNPAAGVILHSAEGYRNGLWLGIENPGVSWHFSILYDGSVWQHHPLTSRVWHAGSEWGNENLIGIEHEGVVGEPLTPMQLKSSVALTRWIARQGGWRMERGKTLFEHREVSSTTCPNGRIPWDAYVEEDEVNTRDLTQREEQVLGKALPLRAGDWLAGANGAQGAEMVVGSSPRRVVITIPDDQWAEAESLA
jgi:hypothetical protein